MQGVMPEDHGFPPPPVMSPETKTRLLIGSLVLLFLCLAVFVNVLPDRQMLRPVESFLIAAACTSPLWGFLGMARMGITRPLPLAAYTPFIWLSTVVTWVALALLSVSGVYYVNVQWDMPQGQASTHTAISKSDEPTRDDPYFQARIPSFTESPLESWLSTGNMVLDRTESFRFSWKDYGRFHPGYARIEVVVYPGHLGLPWVGDYRWVNKPKPRPLSRNPDYWLGLNYFEGKRVPQDDVKAVEYYQKAADAGDADAQHGLGYMYSVGRGGLPQDWVKANEWLRKAAEQGNPASQDDLGVSYGDGRGIEQDWVQSYVWIDRAARQGYAQAVKDIEYAKARMTPEQIERAKALSEETTR